MYSNTKGLVIRDVLYKETSKILTVITEDFGKITVSAKGARRKNSRLAAGTQTLAFSEMTLCESRGRYTLVEITPIELFDSLSEDIELLALAEYFAELSGELTQENEPTPEILTLVLNALYLLTTKKYPPKHVKAVYEFRLACLAGLCPSLDKCAVCGNEEPERPILMLDDGLISCNCCKMPSSSQRAFLCSASLKAFRFISSSAASKIYSFSLSDDAARKLYSASERYLLSQLGRGFQTLDYYKRIST